MIDQTTEGGKRLQAVVKAELKVYLGKDYDDDVLPLYIVVMLAHGNQQPLVADNLDAFLGKEKAVLFAEWLFKHLRENPGKYEASGAPAAEPAAEAAAPIAEQPSIEEVPEEEGSRKRRRDKREKIEWKAEAGGQSKSREEKDTREEKRRKSKDTDRHERGLDRDRDGRRMEDTDGGKRYDAREPRGRHSERDSDRHERRHRRDAPREEERPRRHDRQDAHDRSKERGSARRSEAVQQDDADPNVRTGSRLAGRIGLPGSLTRPARPRDTSPTPPREEARPSVFDRLTNGSDQNADAPRTRMRMDAPDAPAGTSISVEDVYEESLPATRLATGGIQNPDDLASELRKIRESLARLQADKAEATTKLHPSRVHTNTLMAAMNSRKAVVHNVHFNASPDILKAHFSGCGNVASAIIEKDVAGNPKGIAVVEFETEAARKVALTLSGSLLLGRPITVYAKESAPKNTPSAFRAPTPGYRPRAPAPGRGNPGRGFGRGPPGRTTLKNNKYVRPQAAPAQEAKTGA